MVNGLKVACFTQWLVGTCVFFRDDENDKKINLANKVSKLIRYWYMYTPHEGRPPNFSMCIKYAFTTYNNLACWNGLNRPYMQKSSLYVMNVSRCWVSRVLSLKIPMPNKSSLPCFPWPSPKLCSRVKHDRERGWFGTHATFFEHKFYIFLGSNHFECPQGPIFESKFHHALYNLQPTVAL